MGTAILTYMSSTLTRVHVTLFCLWNIKPTAMIAGYPESFLARLPVPHDVIGPLLSRLRSDDVYAQILHYPSPEHRSTALAQQVHVAASVVEQGKLGDVLSTTTLDICHVYATIPALMCTLLPLPHVHSQRT